MRGCDRKDKNTPELIVQVSKIKSVNVLIVGNGHYATGMTVLSGVRKTDKDYGVLLPSVLELRKKGLVNEIGIAARDGRKLMKLRRKIPRLGKEFGWDTRLRYYPEGEIADKKAYVKAFTDMPKPCVVLIAVPDFLHREVAVECAKRHMPFMIVKPAATQLNDLYSILNEAERNNILGMVDYHKVYDEANILLKNRYESGEYGAIQHAFSLMTQRRDMLEIYGRWLKQDKNLNINHYLGSHYIHLVGFITKAEPVDVRAIAQYHAAGKITDRRTADTIETQIRWKDNSGRIFVSYHISGWNDPVETEAMTYQEIHLLCTNGHIDSDQRYRGFKETLAGSGSKIINPYFFNLDKNLFGGANLNNKYGYTSIKTFVSAAINVWNRETSIKDLDLILPTLRESERITAILEAADISLNSNSAIVKIMKHKDHYSIVAR